MATPLRSEAAASGTDQACLEAGIQWREPGEEMMTEEKGWIIQHIDEMQKILTEPLGSNVCKQLIRIVIHSS